MRLFRLWLEVQHQNTLLYLESWKTLWGNSILVVHPSCCIRFTLLAKAGFLRWWGPRLFGHRLSGLLSHQKALSKAGCSSCIASPEPTSWLRDFQVTTLSSTTFNTWKVKMAMVKRKFLFHLGWMIDFKIAVENMKTWLAKVDCKQYTTPSWVVDPKELPLKNLSHINQHQSTMRFFGRTNSWGLEPHQNKKRRWVTLLTVCHNKIDGLLQSQNQSKMALACHGSVLRHYPCTSCVVHSTSHCPDGGHSNGVGPWQGSQSVRVKWKDMLLDDRQTFAPVGMAKRLKSISIWYSRMSTDIDRTFINLKVLQQCNQTDIACSGMPPTGSPSSVPEGVPEESTAEKEASADKGNLSELQP